MRGRLRSSVAFQSVADCERAEGKIPISASLSARITGAGVVIIVVNP